MKRPEKDIYWALNENKTKQVRMMYQEYQTEDDWHIVNDLDPDQVTHDNLFSEWESREVPTKKTIENTELPKDHKSIEYIIIGINDEFDFAMRSFGSRELSTNLLTSFNNYSKEEKHYLIEVVRTKSHRKLTDNEVSQLKAKVLSEQTDKKV